MPLTPRKSDLNVIRDGVEFIAEIAPVKGLHDGATIVFRPADLIPRKSLQFGVIDLRAESKNEPAVRLEVDSTLARITDWDVDCPLEEAKRNPKLIWAPLMSSICNVVWGIEAAMSLEKLQKN